MQLPRLPSLLATAAAHFPGYPITGRTLKSSIWARHALAQRAIIPGLTGVLICILASVVAFGQVAGPPRVPQDQPSAPHLTPEELQHYQHARTILDWTRAELWLRPEFKNLQPAESQSDLPIILQKVGERVARLFEKLPDTTSTEEVRFHSHFVGPQFNGTQTGRRYFRYLLLVHQGQGAPVLDEYRTTLLEDPYGGLVEPRGGTVGKPVDFGHLGHANMLASRLIAAVLNFHPQKQATCRFRYLGRQALDERESLVVAFAQIPDANPEASLLKTPDKTVELMTQGLAWFDAASYEILRIQTDLLAPRRDLGLTKVTIKIDFKAIHIEGVQLVRRGETPTTFQLPTRAVVDATLSGQEFRNIHDYSDYQLFRVESRIDPSTQSALAPVPGGNAPPSTVTPQPVHRRDPWFVPLMVMYGKSTAAGTLTRNSDQEWMSSDFTGKQSQLIRDAAVRLGTEIHDIDAKVKVIVDAQRAANPPPGLPAFRQEFDARLEKEVSDLKVTLGPDLSARLDKYVRTHYVKVPAHSPHHASTTDPDPQIKDLEGYSSVLMSVNANDRGATDLEELEDRDEDGTRLRNQIRANLGFTEEQFEPIRATALRWEAERKELFAREKPMREAYSHTLYAPPELKALYQQRAATIDNEISYLRRTLDPDGCARLDAYFRVHYGL